jgi:hypothetical protein
MGESRALHCRSVKQISTNNQNTPNLPSIGPRRLVRILRRRPPCVHKRGRSCLGSSAGALLAREKGRLTGRSTAHWPIHAHLALAQRFTDWRRFTDPDDWTLAGGRRLPCCGRSCFRATGRIHVRCYAGPSAAGACGDIPRSSFHSPADPARRARRGNRARGICARLSSSRIEAMMRRCRSFVAAGCAMESRPRIKYHPPDDSASLQVVERAVTSAVDPTTRRRALPALSASGA